MTWLSRHRRAQRVVAEQRDPDGDYAALHTNPVSVFEAFALQELERLQAAVMGEPDPNSNQEHR